MKGLKVDFRERSRLYFCVVCNKPLKLNVVNRKLNPPEYCYSCHVVNEGARGHLMKRSVKA